MSWRNQSSKCPKIKVENFNLNIKQNELNFEQTEWSYLTLYVGEE